MSQDLEDLVLSGKFFSTSRSSSPLRSPSRSRSPSPDPLWPSNGNTSDSDPSTSPLGHNSDLPNGAPMDMPQGQPGVKGVIRDRNVAVSLQQAKMAQQIKDTNRRMEKMALSARTYDEDEEERVREKQRLEGRSAQDRDGGPGKRRLFERSGVFGHLREIGMDGFMDAVDNEMSETWVLIHIYDPSLSRCHDLDALLVRLARKYPQTKFLRARAGALDFSTSRGSTTKQSNLITISEKDSYSDDEDDAYLYDNGDDEEQDATDTHVLPTLLAYRSGELVHAWVRVDMDAEAWSSDKGKGVKGIGNVENLLQGHHVLQASGNGNCGFSSDDDDLELEFSRGDDVDDEELFDL